MRLATLALIAAMGGVWLAEAQTPAITNTVGAVTKIDTAAGTLMLKTDAGVEVGVAMVPNASYRRVAPGETNLNNATAIALADIAVGDRVLARGQRNNQLVSATLVVIMSQGDVAAKQAGERADWERRGVLGVVTATAADSISIRVRNLAASTQMTVSPSPKAIIRRYAPDSVNFADARRGTLADIRVGDQIRARGDKSPDGTRLLADEIVSGAFKTIAAIVTSVNPAGGELRANNLESRKPVTIVVNPDSNMRKLPPQAAQMIAVRVHPELAKNAPAAASSGAADLQQLLDRSPKITAADLKAGDAVVISSTVGAADDRVTVITLLSGVEPILTKPGTQLMSLGNWSLDMGGSGGQ